MDLNLIWFLLFGLLVAVYALLDGFDLGVGVLSLFLPREDDRKTCMAAVAPVWDGNEVWLLTAGASLFAAFPPVYASVFSGFYLAFFLLLAALIARAVSIEFRNVLEARPWRRAFDLAFGLGSLLPAVLFGVAVGNVLRGLPIDQAGDFRGQFLDLLNPFSLLFGLLSLAMFLVHGTLYLSLKTTGELKAMATRHAKYAFVAFAVLWLATTVAAYVSDLLTAAVTRPLSWVVLAVLVIAFAASRIFLARGSLGSAFVAFSVVIIASVGLVGLALYPNLVPSSLSKDFSLDIYHHSSSPTTLLTMLVIVAIGMPFIIAYTSWVYYVFRGPAREGYDAH